MNHGVNLDNVKTLSAQPDDDHSDDSGLENPDTSIESSEDIPTPRSGEPNCSFNNLNGKRLAYLEIRICYYDVNNFIKIFYLVNITQTLLKSNKTPLQST